MSFKPNANVENGVYKLIIHSFLGKDLNHSNPKLTVQTLLGSEISIDYSGKTFKSNESKKLYDLTNSVVYQFGRWMEEDNNIYIMETDKIYVRVHTMLNYRELDIDLTGMFRNEDTDTSFSDYGLGNTPLTESLGYELDYKKSEEMKSSFLKNFPHVAELSYGEKVNEVKKHIKTVVDAMANSYGLDSSSKAVIMEDLYEEYVKEVSEEVKLAEIKLKEIRKQNAVISESIED